MAKVLIAGGTGLVGRYLAADLYEAGYTIGILTRGQTQAGSSYHYHHWNPAGGALDQELINHSDHVVNLAGANLGAKRWTSAYKRIIYDSRINSTRLLAEAINRADQPPESFISTSAVNYYGIQRAGLLTEEAAPGSHFLAKVCADWEWEANQVANAHTRVVMPRLATVLAPEEGAFPQMQAPVKWGLGAPLGSGKQRTPWIHIEDLVAILKLAIRNTELQGPYNAASPEHTTNATLMRAIAKARHKPFIFPNVPSVALKTFIGEFADVLMTDLQLDTSKVQQAGMTYQYADVVSAVTDLVGKS